MIVKIGDGYSVAHNFESQVIKLSKSYEWSIWLSSIRNCKLGTIYQFMKAIERFWIWSLYNNKATDNESTIKRQDTYLALLGHTDYY